MQSHAVAALVGKSYSAQRGPRSRFALTPPSIVAASVDWRRCHGRSRGHDAHYHEGSFTSPRIHPKSNVFSLEAPCQDDAWRGPTTTAHTDQDDRHHDAKSWISAQTITI